jgi:hypothetical protein
MAEPVAVRMRRYRRRQGRGLRILPVPVSHYRVIEWLISTGRLSEAAALNDGHVAEAVGRVVHEIVKRNGGMTD